MSRVLTLLVFMVGLGGIPARASDGDLAPGRIELGLDLGEAEVTLVNGTMLKTWKKCRIHAVYPGVLWFTSEGRDHVISGTFIVREGK